MATNTLCMCQHMITVHAHLQIRTINRGIQLGCDRVTTSLAVLDHSIVAGSNLASRLYRVSHGLKHGQIMAMAPRRDLYTHPYLPSPFAQPHRSEYRHPRRMPLRQLSHPRCRASLSHMGTSLSHTIYYLRRRMGGRSTGSI